ncbi:MAG TPA: CHASE domain-containing protein, partial [Pyrinomonadaceae bacterium]|nr:CHASE domain-containing protein [Pyrinomonadaceae bacterium]
MRELQSPSRGSRVFLPYLILLLGFCFTLLVYHYFSKLTYEQDRMRFDRAVQQIEDRLHTRIETSTTLLRAATGLFAASDVVQADEFARFVEQIELDKNYPGVQGIGYSRRFSAADKPKVVTEMQRQGIGRFKVWPDDQPRDEYHAIVYLHPANEPNKIAIGYDMSTEPVRREAMETARDSGKPTASGRVKLVQEKGIQNQQWGFLIYAPVYRKNTSPSTEAERRNALIGYVYSPYRTDDFLRPVISETSWDVTFQVYDGSELTSDNLLTLNPNEAEKDPLFTLQKPLDVAGRTWTLAYATKPSFENASGRPLLKYTWIIGVFLSFLFAAVTRAEINARARAERSTSEVKESEATIRKTLTEREQAEEALRTTTQALREADQRALLEYERLLERIKALAQTLGAARELTAVFRGL